MTPTFNTSKTLEQLENDFWGAPTYDSHLVRTCHDLRKKPLQNFETEDLRIMIGQNIGLSFLIPLAINVLSQNILAEGDLYEGDLLTNVLKCQRAYWINNKPEWEAVILLMKQERSTLENFDTANSIKKEWFELFGEFEAYNWLTAPNYIPRPTARFPLNQFQLSLSMLLIRHNGKPKDFLKKWNLVEFS